ncbi:MAG: S-layer homology domain-containing protein [Thermoleophilia bacterium]|nr:S-layer homology domain-containing protein [Thermoleophilia bacterium]
MRKSRLGIVALVILVVFLVMPAQAAMAGTWTPVESSSNVNHHAVDFIDASQGWVGGITFIPPGIVGFEDSGVISRTSSGGTAWESATSHESGELRYGWNFLTVTALDFVDASKGWAALSDGSIVATTDGGAQWVLQAEGSSGYADNNWGYVSLSMADATHGCAAGAWVGFAGVSYPRIAYTADGVEWKEAELPDLPDCSLDSVCMVDDEYGWAVGSAGPSEQTPLILVTHDGGATWSRQTKGLPGAGAPLHGVWFVDREHGWAVGGSGAVFVTVDGGATWWSQPTGVDETLLAVRFVGPSVGWIVGEDGLLLETTRAGRSWVAQSSGVAAMLRAVAAAGGKVWAVGDEGVILTAAVPAPDPSGAGFADTASSPYGKAIYSLAAAGIVNGFTDGSFRPDATVARAQFAKMIVGALGVTPHSSTVTRFTDLGVPDTADYPHKFVQAAFDRGITYGMNAAQTLFAPWDAIRRDQVVSMIVRGAKQTAAGVLVSPPAGTQSLFADVPEPHGENLRIAEYNGLLEGLAGMGASWSVAAPATRGEVAQMLYSLRLK